VDPRACISGSCVPLKSPDCPIILPIQDVNSGDYDNLLSPNAIILGGFAYIPPALYGTATRNYDLGITELTRQVPGVWAGSSSRHPLVMVVCNPVHDVLDDVLVPARHLIEDLKVPAIVSQMEMKYQQAVFEEFGPKDKNDVFFMMPLYSDQTLINLPDDGLVWHMLSGADALSVTFQPLIDMTEDHLRNLGSIPSGTDNMKVTMLTAQDERFLADMGRYVEDHISFNGALAGENSASTFQSLNVVSAYQDPDADQTTVANNVRDFAPHVILGLTTTEMLTTIIPLIEATWDTETGGQDRPFYILSPLDYNVSEMDDLIIVDESASDGKVPLFRRILGINWPAAVNQDIYDDYQARYLQEYGLSSPYFENFYDAIYYTMYAVAGATQPLTGSRIAAGMLRAIQGTTEVEVGPGPEMASTIDALHTNASYKFKLIGAQGPPTWDVNGGRNDPASVWCVDQVGDFYGDRLRYNSSTMQLDGTIESSSGCNWTFPEPP
jgi:hypothetical protein